MSSSAPVAVRSAIAAVVARRSSSSSSSSSSFGGPLRFKSSAASPNVAVPSPSSSSSSSSSSSPSSNSIPLIMGQSLMAMIAAVGTVSAGAAAVEYGTADTCPRFVFKGQRFDQATFSGRFCRMMLACDPRLLTYGGDDVRRCGEMIRDHEKLLSSTSSSGGDNTMTEAEMSRSLWEAQRISSASLHPDTGDVIPLPFRMSGYVPFNGPICVAMVASTSTPTLLFWSWVNQSQNALVNYYNRNATTGEMSNRTMAVSYGAAVGSALTVAFGLATFIQRRYDPVRAKSLMKYVAFPSAVVASSFNCYIMRSPEIDTGISLSNDKGDDVSPGVTSREAARRGVISTTASRAILQAPVYFLPPVIMMTVPYLRNLVRVNPSLCVPMTTYLPSLKVPCCTRISRTAYRIHP